SDTLQIVIINQIKELYIAGSACENGDGIENAVKMHPVTDTLGTVTNYFEVYMRLNSGSLRFHTNKDGTGDVYGDGCTANSIVADGGDIVSVYDTTVRVGVDLSTLTYTITPVQWGITGNGIMLSGWQSSGYPELDYKGNGVWAKEMVFLAANPATSGNGRARINFIANNSWDWVFDKVRGSNNVVFRATNTITGREVEDVNTNLDGGKLYIALDLQNYTYSISCVETYPNKITVIGSSTPRGTGATNDYGYVGMYGSLLGSRYTGGQSANEWKLSNVCINGNYTGSVWTRWQEDLINNCADYVMIGLTFGNERDNVSPDSAAFENYGKNLFKMIDSVRATGKIPVVGTPYVRADFNAQQYEYIKELNRIISGWDVPSVNLLGAADDLTGKWPDGYWCGDILVDRWHPNDAGHKEFYHAMVPSLFDALKEAKPVPVRTAGNGYTLGNNINGSITLTPEDTAHSFTLSFAVKSEGTGVLVYMNGAEGISINGDGKPVYGSITGAAAINDNNYHRITLTHYYAAGKTLMFIDSTLAGTVDERRVITHYAFGGTAETPNTVTYKELFFYRSAMFDREIADLVRGEMLRSSLEIYSPLDNNLDNSAQSLNVLHLYRKTTSDMFNYDLPRTETYDGTVKRAAVTPKHTGMNTVTVRYNGDTNAPVNAGKYGVTVDMDGNDDFSGAEGLLLDTLTIAKATVTSSHLWSSLQVEDTVAFDGEKHTVLVEAENDVIGLGEITVRYNGDTAKPLNAGTYAVVADIAEGQNYLAAQISLGDFVIKEDYIPDTAELSKSDFIYTLPQTVVYDGTKKSVSVTARMEGTGAVTVKYNGDTTRPVNAGKYEVTVDVQASAVFKEATGLLLDTLTVEKANMLKNYLQWESCGTVLYNGAEHSVAVTFAGNLTVDGFGEITVLYNNDIATPVQTGTYVISANIGEGQNFNSASFVLDTLTIVVNPAIQGPWAATLKVIDKSKGAVTNKVNDQNEINIICAVSDNLKEQNIRNPSPGEWWYPMYGGSGIVPDGELIKTDSSWEWTLTLMADTGTYSWKPYAKTLGWKVINQGMYDYTGDDGDNLIFFMNMGGTVTGNYELVIPDPNVAPNLHIITKNDLNYTLPRTETYDGLPVSVSVTAKYPNMGAITVKYNGSTTVPVNAGLYEITVDIAANDTFEQATGLLLDTLTIAKAAVLSEYLEYRIDSAAYDGLPHSVEVSARADIEGLGDITVLYNNDTAVPVAVGVYEIKADVTEGINYLPAILTLGNFKIYEELSVGISSALKKSHLDAYISNNLLYVSPEATSVRLMSVNGATIFETKGMGRTYDVGMLSDGIYLVLMRNSGEVRTVKVVK
ncbi:MAG: MBG domain-containing protein, partial [Bacteroidales bacterium]|nr:MBG domain-containing protein [Bacteroidales bacterium]